MKMNFQLLKEIKNQFIGAMITTIIQGTGTLLYVFFADRKYEIGMWVSLSMMSISFIILMYFVFCGISNSSKNIQIAEEDIINIIKNKWDEKLRSNPITSKLYLPSHYQQRLDEVLDELTKEEFRNISRKELEKISKEKALVGLKIGHDKTII